MAHTIVGALSAFQERSDGGKGTSGSDDRERLKRLQKFVLRFLCGIALAMSAVLILAATVAAGIKGFIAVQDLTY